MADFNRAINYLLTNEGGFSNFKEDSGGATNWGITLHALEAFRDRLCSVDDVQNLTRDEALRIYKSLYWAPLGLSQVDSPWVAAVILDQGVNHGIVRVAKWVQEIVHVEVDGYVGPKTITAINLHDPNEFVLALKANAEAAYILAATKYPKNKKFLKGWLARAARLLTWKS